jgi:hypothetical protein
MKHVGGDMRNWYLLGHINMLKKMEYKNLKVGITRKDGKAMTMPGGFSTLDG